MTGTWNVLKASVLLHMLDNLLNGEAIVILVAAHYIHQAQPPFRTVPFSASWIVPHSPHHDFGLHLHQTGEHFLGPEPRGLVGNIVPGARRPNGPTYE